MKTVFSLAASVFIWLFLFPVQSLGGNSNTTIDSLEEALKKSGPDTLRVILLNKLSFQQVHALSYAKALSQGRHALDLSIALKYKKGEAKSFINIGNVYLAKSELDSAGYFYLLGLKAAEQIRDIKVISDCTNNLGEVFRRSGNYEKAVYYDLEALKAEETFANKQDVAVTLNNLGLVYQEQKNLGQAIAIYKQSMEISRALGDSFMYSANLTNIGSALLDEQDYKTALAYYLRALSLCRNTGNELGVGKSLSGIGGAYQALHQQKEARKYFELSLAQAGLINDRCSAGEALLSLGLLDEQEGKVDLALAEGLKSLSLATGPEARRLNRQAYLFLSRSFMKTGNAPKALEYLKAYTALNDSLHQEESNKVVAEMQARYESEKKQKENEALTVKNEALRQEASIQALKISRNRYLLLGFSLLCLLIAGIAFLLIRQGRINAQREKSEISQKLLRSQMNPHFIFNAMVGIQKSIYQEEPERAADYLSSVVHLMRSILEHSQKESITLDEEISTLKHYLTLQQLRFGNAFRFNIDVDAALDTATTTIPPMMAQPFIENAIVHGVLPKTDGTGQILLQFKKEVSGFSITIEDNGIGREKAGSLRLMDSVHLSAATQITLERLVMLNRKSKPQNSLTITDLKDNAGEAKGTRVVFFFSGIKNNVLSS